MEGVEQQAWQDATLEMLRQGVVPSDITLSHLSKAALTDLARESNLAWYDATQQGDQQAAAQAADNADQYLNQLGRLQ